MGPRLRGDDTECVAHALSPIQFSNSQRSAARILYRPRAGRSPDRRPRKEPRARGTPRGPGGPAGLDASRHRGLSKSDNRKSAKPKASRARCLLGLLRLAPGGLTVSGNPTSSFELAGRLSTAVSPGRAQHMITLPEASHHTSLTATPSNTSATRARVARRRAVRQRVRRKKAMRDDFMVGHRRQRPGGIRARCRARRGRAATPAC